MNRNATKTTSGALTLPAAIIIAGALVAVALIWVNKPASSGRNSASGQNSPAAEGARTAIAIVTNADHILGNPNAPIKLIEYSDLSCPFCKLFNPALVQIMDAYGPGGKVAWIYRHFPLFKPVNGQVPHPNSLVQAEALECAAQLGGNTAFFAFEKKWFTAFPETGANRSPDLDRREIDKVAKDIGLDMSSFGECMASRQFKGKIDKAYEDGLRAGIDGTPFTIILTPSGNMIPMVGIQTYATMKSTIDTLITTIEPSTP